MAEFSKLVITRKGQALLAKMLAGHGDIAFSKISASDVVYEVEQLETLDALADVRQSNRISRITRTNEVAVKVETAFSNTELTEGYYMRTLGLYANDPEEGEILYAVTTETTGNCYMPAYNGVTVSGAYIQLVSTVGNAENVSVEIDQAAIATIGNIQDLQKQIDEIWGKDADGNSPGFAEGIESDNVIGAINEVFTLGSESKQKLVDNLIAMGIDASTEESWGTLLDKVLDMTDTSEDTVTAEALLAGHTAHNAAGEQITGSMPEWAGATVDATETTQDSEYTYLGMPEGHYDVASRVRTKNSNLDTWPNTLHAFSGSMPQSAGCVSYATLSNPNANKYKRMSYNATSANDSNSFVRINNINVNGSGYIGIGTSVSVIMRTEDNRTPPSCDLYWTT